MVAAAIKERRRAGAGQPAAHGRVRRGPRRGRAARRGDPDPEVRVGRGRAVGGRPGGGLPLVLRDRDGPRCARRRRRSRASRASRTWSIGGLDLLRDLYARRRHLPMLYVRSHLVVVLPGGGAAAAGRQRLPADRRRRRAAGEAEFVRSLGFFGEVGDPPAADPDPARGVRAVGARPGVGAARCSRRSRPRAAARPGCPDGEFVDLPVAQRAQRVLEIAGLQWRQDHLGA